MPTLAQRLPYLHPFAGGYPYRGSQRLPSDPDALTYLAAVAAADGAPVETAVAVAVDDFFRGMKAGGTFGALKAACLLCGARTLAGALVPLAGDAPTNYNFLPEDYNRETGLAGNGSTKYLNSGRANDADPQNDYHIAVYKTSISDAVQKAYVGQKDSGTSFSVVGEGGLYARTTGNILTSYSGSSSAGLFAFSRTSAINTNYRFPNAIGSAINASVTPDGTLNTYVFSRSNAGGSAIGHTDARLAFYSIGESISDLAALDARVTALVQRIQLSLSTGLDASGYDDATVAYLLAAYNNGATLE
jgi:hypothetical protein